MTTSTLETLFSNPRDMLDNRYIDMRDHQFEAAFESTFDEEVTRAEHEDIFGRLSKTLGSVVQGVAPRLLPALPAVVQGRRVDSGIALDPANFAGMRTQSGSGARRLGERSMRFVADVAHLCGNGISGLRPPDGNDNPTPSEGVWSWDVYLGALGATRVPPKTFESRGL